MEGILVVDKPSGPTSHGIVNIVRKATGLRKVGHTGTLDPMATGVMVLLLGRATRIGRFLRLEPKEYMAEAMFGIVTDSQDITGIIVKESTGRVSLDQIENAIPDFTGDILQVPPMVSAVKIGGKTLYKLARQGKEIERPKRPVTIYEFELLDYFESDGRQKATFRVLCSGGTYVRTLIHDLGEKLGVGATLTSLRRTRVGEFTLSGAIDRDSIEAGADTIATHVIDTDRGLSHLPAVTVKDEAVTIVLNGGKLQERLLESYPELARTANFVRIKSGDGRLLAIGRPVDRDGIVVAPSVVFTEN